MKPIRFLTLSIFAFALLASTAFTQVEPRPPAESPPPLNPVTLSPDEMARFLAGMPVPKNSPLAPLTNEAPWQAHASFFAEAFGNLVRGKLAKFHTWQNTYMPQTKQPVPVVYYMFSGPDYLYVDQFIPNASVYIMCGKEEIGPAPDPLRIVDLRGALQNLENAMKSALTTSYFITQDMKIDLQEQQLRGVLPILYVFLARADKTIREVTFVNLDRDGAPHESRPGRGGTPGVRIDYTDNGSGRDQTVFYFTTDISDGGIASNPAFMKFCDRYGVGFSFLKSSSYLMFEEGFARVRNFILDHSKMIVQDDSGIPLSYFNRDKWNLRFFGTYVGPIDLFRKYYQAKLQELYQLSNPPEFGMGFGYQWDARKSNLMIAERQ
ncbi:MAG: hypothetical protein DME34_05545 [Verrucomicrobia bacterium]|nr:MAG: hypothetical protein DME34_05545 [Verrucomicrobiota bacterium]